MHGGTALDRMETTIGEHGLFMAGSHVAHDCVVGDHAILANGTGIAGHVSLGDHVYLGGYSAVHPFVRIGSHVIVGGGSIIVDDIIPFGAVVGARAMLDGLNIIGLRRRGFTAAQISALRAAYNTLFVVETGLFSERLESLKTADSEDVVDLLVKFIETKGKRPLCHPER
jgi:UDP-N-acetylglucosamine acyltransferase